MIEKLILNGKLEGSYEGQGFRLEFKEKQIKSFFESIDTLQTVKDLFYDKLKKAKEDPSLEAFFKSIDIEVYLNDELIAKIGKNASSNFISSMLGLPFFEVVANSRMSDLMGLM